MPLCTESCSPSHDYLRGPGAFCWNFNKQFDVGGYFFKGITGVITVALNALKLQGKTEHPATQNLASGVATGEVIFSVTRVIYSFEKLITGKLFFKQNDDWSFKTEEKGADTSKIHAKVPRCVDKEWMFAVMEVLLAVGRVLSIILKLAQMGFYELGKHAKGMVAGLIAVYAGVVSLSFAMAATEVVESGWQFTKRQVVDLVSSIFDIVSYPFETGIFAKAHPGVLIAGGIAMMASGFFYAWKEWQYFNAPPDAPWCFSAETEI